MGLVTANKSHSKSESMAAFTVQDDMVEHQFCAMHIGRRTVAVEYDGQCKPRVTLDLLAERLEWLPKIGKTGDCRI
jgi:hypothetical protein